MLKRPIEGTKGPAQTALLMITLQQIEEEEEEDISQLDILPPAWMLGYLEWRKVRFLLACGRTTAWGSTWSSTLPRTMHCRDCGMLLKQMIRIRETQHESVLLASRCRVAPRMAGRTGLPPCENRLLSEMSASSGPSVPRSRSV